MTGKEKALFLAYPILWTFSVVSFWCFGSASDALGFTLLHLYLLHPAAIVGVSTAAAWNAPSLRSMRMLPIALAAGYMLCDFFTFRLANMAAFSHGTPPEWIMLCRSVWRSRLRDSFSGESFAVLSLEKTESQSTARAWMSASYPAEPVDFLFLIVLDETNSHLKTCLRDKKNLIERRSWIHVVTRLRSPLVRIMQSEDFLKVPERIA